MLGRERPCLWIYSIKHFLLQSSENVASISMHLWSMSTSGCMLPKSPWATKEGIQSYLWRATWQGRLMCCVSMSFRSVEWSALLYTVTPISSSNVGDRHRGCYDPSAPLRVSAQLRCGLCHDLQVRHALRLMCVLLPLIHTAQSPSR